MDENKTQGADGDTMNFKAMLDRLKKKTAYAGADDIKPSATTAADENNAVQTTHEEETMEVALDIEDIKKEIAEAVSAVLAANGDTSDKELTEGLANVDKTLDSVKRRLQAIQMATEEGIHKNGNSITSLQKSFYELREQLTEITQTVSGVSKVSDSVFNLKNAQINMKKSIDSMDTAIRRLKRRMSVSTAILSIIGVLIMVLQIISLLS